MVEFNRDGNSSRCPCKGCTERYEACHSKCEKFAEWRVKIDEARKAEREQRAKDFLLNEDAKRRIWKSQRWALQNTKYHRSDIDR